MRTGAGQVYQLNPRLSEVRIYAFRAGEARQFGHNHVLSAPDFKGYVYLAKQQGPDSARFHLEFRLDQLELDKPDVRSALGGSFASQLTPAMVDSTREHMLGEFGLQAERFPWVRIASVQVMGEAPKFSARIAVELHGVQHTQWVPLTVQSLPGALRVEGALVLLQSDFGVRPYSVLGGLLSVQDPVVLEFKLQCDQLPLPP